MAKITTAEPAKVDVDAIKKAIRELESPRAKRERERVALFSELYPDLRDQLKADVSKTAIIKKLVDHGVSMSNLIFEELLEAEALRRGEPVPGKGDKAGEDLPASDNAPPDAPQAGTKVEVAT
ncbi:hypothetical protein LFL96_00945 [Paraburkholderia sp. D15]|uniref:hypothetical protein n=1 Tax=Paraburkholderia sp. D15 TaxID=2880218 RepID=UPI0024787D06|nr:hypothetical protein [Paraburkholderia sp. D15]WGS50108.1 hypothetical protein LFL96_00945 [Paraburkholderia sp. D15]